eukprot:scaffold155319_cov32-Prasinocladus_malaysianus.AAC.2
MEEAANHEGGNANGHEAALVMVGHDVPAARRMSNRRAEWPNGRTVSRCLQSLLMMGSAKYLDRRQASSICKYI